MIKYTTTTTLKNIKIKYLCDHPDSQPGDVEPCAGTDTDEPSCGIAIMDTDGEWIEVKDKNTVPYAMLVMPISKKHIVQHVSDVRFAGCQFYWQPV